MIFPNVLSGKMTFLFPETMTLFFRGKMKDDLSQKIHENMIFSSNAPKRWYFQKKLRWNMIFLVLSGKMRFSFWKIDFFFGQKVKNDLSQEIHGNAIFSVYMYKCYKCDITLLQS